MDCHCVLLLIRLSEQMSGLMDVCLCRSVCLGGMCVLVCVNICAHMCVCMCVAIDVWWSNRVIVLDLYFSICKIIWNITIQYFSVCREYKHYIHHLAFIIKDIPPLLSPPANMVGLLRWVGLD